MRNFDALADDIRGVLGYVAPPHEALLERDGTISGSLDLTSDHTLPEAVAWIQISMFVILLGGVSAAILATVLARRAEKRQARWAAQWSQIFLAGFVFQLTNLLIVTFLLFGVSIEAGVELLLHWEGLAIASFLILNIVCSAAALRAWRILLWHAMDHHTSLGYRNLITS